MAFKSVERFKQCPNVTDDRPRTGKRVAICRSNRLC